MTDLTTEQLSGAAGLGDRSSRRARQALLASGELLLLSGVGGRGNANRWEISDPLVAPVAASVSPMSNESPPTSDPGRAQAAGKGGQDQTPSRANHPILAGVCDVKGGQDQTLFDASDEETPAERAAKPRQKPRHQRARAGKEPQNPRIPEDPPAPWGGSPPDSMFIEQAYVTVRGGKRRRAVRVDLAAVRRGLGMPTREDRGDWERIQSLLFDAVGESTFAIWLEPLELIAIDTSGALVIAASPQTASWVRERFGRLIAGCAQRVGRELRLADEPERRALGRDDGRPRRERVGAWD